MLITPLWNLALLRIPALTSVFSDVLSVATLSIVASGTSTVDCGSTPHGIAIGGPKVGIAIIDALTPNAITAWSLLDSTAVAPNRAGDVVITVTYPHSMSTAPDSYTNAYEAWNLFAILSGTAISAINGNAQLVSVPSTTSFVVRPSGSLTLGSVPGGAVLLERLEREVIGWHAATATSKTVLTFPTPASVTRSYTVASPSVATNIRAWGAVSLLDALRHFTRDDEANKIVLDQAYLFITPRPQVRLSRDRNSRSDAMTEIQPGAFVSQLLMDGFNIYAVLPAERYGGAVGCIDRANGEILTAVLRTFNGLRLPFTELSSPNAYVSMLTSHSRAHYDRANYVHEFVFEVTVFLSQGDGIAPNEVPDMVALDPNGPVQSTGTVPLGSITFNPGIFQQDNPQPLTATVNFPDPD